jgi:hypothetical protein
VDRQRLHVDPGPDPNFHFDADPDPAVPVILFCRFLQHHAVNILNILASYLDFPGKKYSLATYSVDMDMDPDPATDPSISI